MIPEIEDVLSGYAFYARRYKLPDANEREVMVALKLARSLANDRGYDEPAAMLYAFTVARRGFGVRWRQMALRLAQNQAASQGKLLVADDDTLSLIEGIQNGERSYEQTCLWMALRLKSVY
jgi:hypothetical protein